MLGNLTCEPVLGNLVWEPVAGNLAWEPCAVRIWLLRPASETFTMAEDPKLTLLGKTRWKPRTRMYSRSWSTRENLCNRKTNLFFHASCAHIVSAKAPDQQVTKRQLTHKDTHGKHRLKTVHISPVTSLQCGVESVECGVWSVEWKV